jgi:guanylate kinase
MCCILEIDYQGAISVRKSKLNPFTVFVFPPSLPALEKRLRGRGTESEETIKLRMNNAKIEIEFAARNEGNIYDQFIVNDDLEECYKQLKDLIDENLTKLTK